VTHCTCSGPCFNSVVHHQISRMRLASAHQAGSNDQTKKGWTHRVHPHFKIVVLAAQTERLNRFRVAVFCRDLQVIKKLPATSHHLQQPTARGVVFRVFRQMLCQVIDTSRQQRDLHIGAAGVLLMQLEGVKGGCCNFAHGFVSSPPW